MKDVNGRFIIQDGEQLKRWKENYTMVLSRITSGEVSLLADDPSRREIISAINAFIRGKAAGLDGLHAKLFTAASPVTAHLLLPLVWKSWESETIPREWMKGMIVKTPQKGVRFGCGNLRGICCSLSLQFGESLEPSSTTLEAWSA